MTFAEKDGKTTVTVNWWPYEASEDERKTFDAAREGMQGGWGGTFQQLADYLPEVLPRV